MHGRDASEHDGVPPDSAEPRPLPRTALPHEVLRAALDALDQGARVLLASVVARHGSAPSTPGQKLALLDEHTAIGTIGGGAVERVVLARMLAARDNLAFKPILETFSLGPSLGMCCGGSAQILIESLEPLLHVLIVGAGHIGVFTAPLLAAAGFQVTLCDAREALADPARLSIAPPSEAAPAAAPLQVLHAQHDDPEVLAALPRGRGRVALLVMTHDHQLDQVVIEWALARGFGFVGGVGSRAKAARTRARLSARGVAAADIERVRMPLGADIGARSPAEIGISIAAEMVSWRAHLASRRAQPADTTHTDADDRAAPAHHDGVDPHTPGPADPVIA